MGEERAWGLSLQIRRFLFQIERACALFVVVGCPHRQRLMLRRPVRVDILEGSEQESAGGEIRWLAQL
jgi:hypothetical protein